MPAKVVDIGYIPRPQFVDYHTREQRFSVIVAHRRFGKTVGCLVDELDAALRLKKKAPRFAFVSPLLKQAKDTAWTYLKDYGSQIPGATFHENELRCDLPNGGRVRLYGGDNPDSLRGIYLDGVVLDEYGDHHPRLYPEIIRPCLSDRKGWATFIGTPKGPNAFHELWQKAQGDPDYFTRMLRASETGILDAGELQAAQNDMTPEQYAREYECSFAAANVGSFYGKDMELALKEERIIKGVFSNTHEVHTAWDLGWNDMTVIWFFQKVGMQIWLVDYYSNNLQHLDHYAKVLQDRGYKYGQHYLPHDVKQTHQGQGVGSVTHSRINTLNNLGVKVTTVDKHEVMDGVNAVRKILPRCVFDVKKCDEGIKALQLYHREYDDERKVYLEKPYKDWTSHPADAFRYMAMSLVDKPATLAKPSWMKKTKDRLGWVV